MNSKTDIVVKANQMVDLQGQYLRLKPEIDAAMGQVLASSRYIGGQMVNDFSQKLAEYLSVKHVIPCANGTDALQIALMALDLKEGDEVITTPFTFVATVEVLVLLKLKPVFVDVHPDTFNIDETKLEAAITNKTRCIIPVHLFGQGCNMEVIMEIANNHGLKIIEDNAQAIGADFHFKNGESQKLGTLTEIGTTSFFPSKNLGCYGDGGAVFTNDDDLAANMRSIANHGMEKRYYYDKIGMNSRLDALQAAVLGVKLNYLEEFCQARRLAAKTYNDQLKDLAGVHIPIEADYSNHVYHQYTLKVEHGRDELRTELSKNNIASAIYYPVPLHKQKAYEFLGFHEGDFPVSESLSKQVISLPMHTELDHQTQAYIVDHIKRALS